MDTRQERGLQIASTCKIERSKLGWKVPSQSGNGSYIVNLDHGAPFCTCPDFETRNLPCKHIHAVEFILKNAETTFSMIKGKFGSAVRAKTPTAQVNEVLCKILCHNICVLIQSIYELGLEPTFWTFGAKEPVAPKVLGSPDF